MREPQPFTAASMSEEADIILLESRIRPETLRRLAERGFGEMVKYVVDVQRNVIAIGGELHADAEQLLLETGSRPEDLWGANYYPGRGRDGCVEFTSLINVRPARGNLGMEVQDPELREKIRTLTHALVGDSVA